MENSPNGPVRWGEYDSDTETAKDSSSEEIITSQNTKKSKTSTSIVMDGDNFPNSDETQTQQSQTQPQTHPSQDQASPNHVQYQSIMSNLESQQPDIAGIMLANAQEKLKQELNDESIRFANNDYLYQSGMISQALRAGLNRTLTEPMIGQISAHLLRMQAVFTATISNAQHMTFNCLLHSEFHSSVLTQYNTLQKENSKLREEIESLKVKNTQNTQQAHQPNESPAQQEQPTFNRSYASMFPSLELATSGSGRRSQISQSPSSVRPMTSIMNNRGISQVSDDPNLSIIFENVPNQIHHDLKEYFLQLINTATAGKGIMTPISIQHIDAVYKLKQEGKYKVQFTKQETADFLLRNKLIFSESTLATPTFIQPSLSKPDSELQYRKLKQFKSLRKRTHEGQQVFNFRVFPCGHSLKILTNTGQKILYKNNSQQEPADFLKEHNIETFTSQELDH